MAADRTSLALVICCLVVVTAHAGRQPQSEKKKASSVVSQVCSDVDKKSCSYGVTGEWCLSELRSDKDSKDAKNLTLVAIDLVKQSAAAADAKIAALLRTTRRPKGKQGCGAQPRVLPSQLRRDGAAGPRVP